MAGEVVGGAGLSEDRRYRYVLWREADPRGRGFLLWVMLNPSTADEEKDDATIRRCLGYARRWGFRYIVVVNLFAWRAKDPKELRREGVDPVGPLNDLAIAWAASFCDLVVCAWGTHGTLRDRGGLVCRALEDAGARPHRFVGLTKNGQPLHPLYLPSDLPLVPACCFPCPL